MLEGSVANSQEDFIDEYVVGIQNPSQLVSSLALLLREKNYVCLYDTSIFSSPEQYLKKNSLEDLSKDFLYKWFLFFTGLFRNISNFSNLILLPQVSEEMFNLTNAILSAIDKRKNQYKASASAQKDAYQDIFEQLVKNEEILLSLANKLAEIKARTQPLIQPVFETLLELIKFLNVELELKKMSSRMVDTDERICARTFYEVLVNSSNVAVYTRDDDIRKLISATFRLLTSKQILEAQEIPSLKNLSHLNILVMKYDYQKRSFSRFFESSTLSNFPSYNNEYRFSRKLPFHKIDQVISTVLDLLRKIEDELKKIHTKSIKPEPEPVVKTDNEEIPAALNVIFDCLCKIEDKKETQSANLKIKILENLSVLAKLMNYPDLHEKISLTNKQYRKNCIENILGTLQTEKERLWKDNMQLLAQPKEEMEYLQKVKTTTEIIQENMMKISFFETALRTHFYHASLNDYENFRKLKEKFSVHGFFINAKEAPVPTQKISEITGHPTSEIIRIIETYNIRCQSTCAYLNQDHIIFFLNVKNR